MTSGTEFYDVEAFAEKPDKETAQAYMKGGYLWNSGMFAFTIEAMTKDIEYT